MSGFRPVGLSINNFEPKLVKGDVRIRCFKVQIRRDRPAIDRQDRLDESDDARGGFQVPEVGFDSAGQQWCIRLSAPPVDRPQSTRFDGVAEQCAGAVRLDVVDL